MLKMVSKETLPKHSYKNKLWCDDFHSVDGFVKATVLGSLTPCAIFTVTGKIFEGCWSFSQEHGLNFAVLRKLT